MDKRLAVEVVVEVRKAVKIVVEMLAEAELAVKTDDKERMRLALERIIGSKSSVLLRLAGVVGLIEGNITNRSILSKMWDRMKG